MRAARGDCETPAEGDVLGTNGRTVPKGRRPAARRSCRSGARRAATQPCVMDGAAQRLQMFPLPRSGAPQAAGSR